MRTTSRLVILLLLGAAAAGFCGGQQGPAAPQGELTIGMTLPGIQFPFFAAMKSGLDQAAARLGVVVIYIDAQNDSARQAAAMEDLVGRRVNGILACPMSPGLLVPAIEDAVKARIPVVTVDRRADSDKVLLHVGSDNVEGGRAAARFVVQKLGGNGAVIELEGTAGTSAAADRKKGFDQIISQNPGMKILAGQDAGFDRGRGRDVMDALLKAYPGCDAVFGANDEMILGAIDAMSAAGVDLSRTVTVGYDATPDAVTYIRQGKLGATVDQLPGEQAARALQYLVDYLRNGTLPPSRAIYLPPRALTAEDLK